MLCILFQSINNQFTKKKKKKKPPDLAQPKVQTQTQTESILVYLGMFDKTFHGQLMDKRNHYIEKIKPVNRMDFKKSIIITMPAVEGGFLGPYVCVRFELTLIYLFFVKKRLAPVELKNLKFRFGYFTYVLLRGQEIAKIYINIREIGIYKGCENHIT